jgi:hypothetical protein
MTNTLEKGTTVRNSDPSTAEFTILDPQLHRFLESSNLQIPFYLYTYRDKNHVLQIMGVEQQQSVSLSVIHVPPPLLPSSSLSTTFHPIQIYIQMAQQSIYLDKEKVGKKKRLIMQAAQKHTQEKDKLKKKKGTRKTTHNRVFVIIVCVLP